MEQITMIIFNFPFFSTGSMIKYYGKRTQPISPMLYGMHKEITLEKTILLASKLLLIHFAHFFVTVEEILTLATGFSLMVINFSSPLAVVVFTTWIIKAIVVGAVCRHIMLLLWVCFLGGFWGCKK